MNRHRFINSPRLWLLAALTLLTAMAAVAQPPARRAQAEAAQGSQAQQQARKNQQMTQRALLKYPVATDMPEEVVWRRDIYREIELSEGANAGLYYPIQPKGRQMNLFTYIFKLAQNGYIPIYEYSPTESEERLTADAVQAFKDMLDDKGIFYEEQNGKLVIDNSDIPSEEVTRYFLKESAYYDQANATFHRKVLALCPVMVPKGDFGDEAPRPMFWVKYSELEPYLNRQTVMTSDLNNAATMTMDDFFTRSLYSGKIYRTTNMLGRNLQDYCPDSASLSKEQQRIEAELLAFRTNIFGDPARRDSLDSVATAQQKPQKSVRRASSSNEPRQRTPKASRQRSSSGGGNAGSGAARVSVRRQRH